MADKSEILLITGASSGVGLSLAHHLAGRFHVLAAARSIDRLDFEFGSNPEVTVYEVDLAERDSLARFLDRVTTEYGHIGYVINNAGTSVGSVFLDELEESDILRSLQVNAISPTVIMKHMLPAMKSYNFGRVINVTSGAPLNCYPGYSAYSASKAALNAFTVTAARECADYNIKINLMSPGPVRTNMAPDAPMEPSACHPTADYLLALGEDGPTGRFFWLGYEIPLTPDLAGIEWLEGRADDRFQKAF